MSAGSWYDVFFFSVSAACLMVVNKLCVELVPLPSLLCSLQLAVTVAVALLFKWVGLAEVDGFDEAKVRSFLVFTTLFSCTLYTSVRALAASNIATVLVFRSCGPLVIALFEWQCASGAALRPLGWIALAVVVASTAAFMLTDSALRLDGWVAYTWVAVYLLFDVASIAYGKSLAHTSVSMWGRVLYTNALSLPQTLLIAIFSGELDTLRNLLAARGNEPVAYSTARTLGTSTAVACSCVLGVSISFYGWRTRRVLAASEYAMLGLANKIVTVILSVVIWNGTASAGGLCALTLCLLGSSAFLAQRELDAKCPAVNQKCDGMWSRLVPLAQTWRGTLVLALVPLSTSCAMGYASRKPARPPSAAIPAVIPTIPAQHHHQGRPLADEQSGWKQRVWRSKSADAEHALAGVSDGQAVLLNSGHRVPALAIGTACRPPSDCTTASMSRVVSAALAAGIHHVDTSEVYPGAARAIALATRSMPREGFAITTKLDPTVHCDARRHAGEQGAGDMAHTPTACATALRAAFSAHLAELHVEYVDVLLLHRPPLLAPAPGAGSEGVHAAHSQCSRARAHWRVLEDEFAAGRARAIGVSNYCASLLQCVLGEASIRPAVWQQVHHIGMGADPLGYISWARAHGIAYQAVSVLGGFKRISGSVLGQPLLQQLAAVHRVDGALVAYQWARQLELPIVFGSMSVDHVRANAEALGSRLATPSAVWRLSDGEMAALSALVEPRGEPSGWGNCTDDRRLVTPPLQGHHRRTGASGTPSGHGVNESGASSLVVRRHRVMAGGAAPMNAHLPQPTTAPSKLAPTSRHAKPVIALPVHVGTAQLAHRAAVNRSRALNAAHWQRIPKLVWQTSHLAAHELPDQVQVQRARMARDNPEYTFHLVNDSSLELLIRTSFDPEVLRAFRSVRWGVSKSEFFRYCFLYKHGGVYLDVDSSIDAPLRELIRADDSAILSAETRWPHGCPLATANTSAAAKAASSARGSMLQLLYGTTKLNTLPGQTTADRSVLQRIAPELVDLEVASFMIIAEPRHPLIGAMVREMARAVNAWHDTPATTIVPLHPKALFIGGPCMFTMVTHRAVSSGEVSPSSLRVHAGLNYEGFVNRWAAKDYRKSGDGVGWKKAGKHAPFKLEDEGRRLSAHNLSDTPHGLTHVGLIHQRRLAAPLRPAASGDGETRVAQLPLLGLGLGWRDESAMPGAIDAFLALGGRLLDTAIHYGNHDVVRAALAAPRVRRSAVYLVSKLGKAEMGYRQAVAAIERTLHELGVQQLDLMLIHHPVGGGAVIDRETWRALVEAKAAGKCRHIGLSNINRRGLEHLSTLALPDVVELEFHPWVPLHVKRLALWCQVRGIALIGYGSLGGAAFERANYPPSILHLAVAHGVSPELLMLRWVYEHNVTTIFGSRSPKHIAQNLNVTNFELTPAIRHAVERAPRPRGWRDWKQTPGAKEECLHEWTRFVSTQMRAIRRQRSPRRLLDVAAFRPSTRCVIEPRLAVEAARTLVDAAADQSVPFILLPPHLHFDEVPRGAVLSMRPTQPADARLAEVVDVLRWQDASACAVPSDGLDRRVAHLEQLAPAAAAFHRSAFLEELALQFISRFGPANPKRERRRKSKPAHMPPSTWRERDMLCVADWHFCNLPGWRSGQVMGSITPQGASPGGSWHVDTLSEHARTRIKSLMYLSPVESATDAAFTMLIDYPIGTSDRTGACTLNGTARCRWPGCTDQIVQKLRFNDDWFEHLVGGGRSFALELHAPSSTVILFDGRSAHQGKLSTNDKDRYAMTIYHSEDALHVATQASRPRTDQEPSRCLLSSGIPAEADVAAASVQGLEQSKSYERRCAERMQRCGVTPSKPIWCDGARGWWPSGDSAARH